MYATFFTFEIHRACKVVRKNIIFRHLAITIVLWVVLTEVPLVAAPHLAVFYDESRLLPSHWMFMKIFIISQRDSCHERDILRLERGQRAILSDKINLSDKSANNDERAESKIKMFAAEFKFSCLIIEHCLVSIGFRGPVDLQLKTHSSGSRRTNLLEYQYWRSRLSASNWLANERAEKAFCCECRQSEAT